MLNKKKVFITIFILVFIIVVLVLILGKEDKVSKLYDNLINRGQYSFEMTNNDNYDIVISQKDENTCIDMNNADEKTTTLLKDGVTYLIIHSQKQYMVYNNNISDENIIMDMFSGLKEKKHTNGKEKIENKKYKYEEFQGFAGFMISTAKDIDESKIKTRFYFEGNDLKYIKTISEDGEELLQVTILYNVDDNLFEIPSDYLEAN